MSRAYVQHFHHLALTLLTEEEVEFLYKTLRKYQRSSDIGKLAKTLGQLLNTPERGKLLPYIRAPMSRAERNHFDKLMGVQGQGSITLPPSEAPGLLRRITTPPVSNSVLSSPERLVTIYGSRGGSMGFSIRGGSEFGLGIYVSNVRAGTPAAEASLHVGDHIISANGVDFQCIANSSAVKVLSSTALLNLVVVRCGKVPEWKVAREKVLWYDVALCRVVNSPPVSESPSTSAQPNVLVERKVVLSITKETDFIGLNIRGGREYGIGIYVSRVDPGGLASKVGLSAGDQIVRVNESDFLSITHTDAVDALRSSTHLIVTIRSVGKFPVYKELYAEYTWSDAVGNVPGHRPSITSVTGISRIVTVPGDNPASRKHTQRTRTRESSIDLTPLPYANSNNHIDDSDLDDAIEELDDCLETECKLFYPGDNDIMFRKDYEDSWQRIDALHDNYSRPEDLTSSWSVDKHDSLGHHRHDSDLSDNMVDYTTFLEQSALRDQRERMKPKTQPLKASHNMNDDDNVVIETTIEEGVTSFVSNSHSPIVLSTHPMPDDFETNNSDHVYSQVTDLTGKTVVVGQAGTTRSNRSSTSSSQPSTPIYATVNKPRRGSKGSLKTRRAPDAPVNGGVQPVNGTAVDNKDEDLEVLNSQIERLEARKSNLGSWEITRVAGGTPAPTSPGSSEASFESYDKQKTGTWTSLKKKLKGSLRIGSANKKRSSLPSADAYAGNSPSSPTSSLQQKGMFERSFGSQILNSQMSERYNLMGMLEDHARILLTEDECKAVLRHIHNYHENKQLERLVDLLLAILDKDDKKLLLVDVRNVIAPAHIERFDALIEHCNIQGYDQWLTKFNMQEDNISSPSQTRPVKPARARNGVHSNGKSKSYDVNNTDAELADHVPQFSKADFEKMPSQLEVVILESDEMDNRATPIVEPGEEIVYVSKHKIFLGLEISGGRNDPVDQTIRIQQVRIGGAAADDHRLQPGVELTKVDGQSLLGMSKGEVESLLQTSFSTKKPVNLGIQIRRKYQL